MDIPLDTTLDDLKKIINDKRNIPQDNLYTLFHFCTNDEIDEEDGTSKVTELLKINEADQEYHIDLSHDNDSYDSHEYSPWIFLVDDNY